MAKLNSFRELIVWQKVMSLSERCYQMSKRFHRDDQAALGTELRRTCISIPSNIAEGFGRYHTAEYVRYLWISNGSNCELQTQVDLARRVEIVKPEDASILIADAEEIGRMLRGLVSALERPTRN